MSSKYTCFFLFVSPSPHYGGVLTILSIITNSFFINMTLFNFRGYETFCMRKNSYFASDTSTTAGSLLSTDKHLST